MAGKSKVAQTPTAVQPGNRVPLSDIAITYHRHAHFVGEEGDVPVTIGGADLGRVLHWMSRDAPGHPTKFTEAQYLGRKVRAVGFVCRMLATSDHPSDDPDQLADVMWLLGDILDDYGVRMEVQREDTDKTLAEAHIAVAHLDMKVTTAVA
jgi:hypothetical protein